MQKLPEGVEIDIITYVYSPSTDAEVRLRVGGFTSISEDFAKEVDITALKEFELLKEIATDWRVMTREEISDYKRREREEEE